MFYSYFFSFLLHTVILHILLYAIVYLLLLQLFVEENPIGAHVCKSLIFDIKNVFYSILFYSAC